MNETYKSAGVDIERADVLKSKIKEIAKRTMKKYVIHGIGPFAAVLKMPSELVVATCDGVGTKIALAQEYGKVEVLGYDLVAMNVNDIIAMHGKPIFFLDYIGIPNLDVTDIEKIVKSMSDACLESDCSLVGGETAQMPNFYLENRFELVGFCVGSVKKKDLPKKEKVKPGDIVLAFPSNGVHSNGFSLIRKLIEEKKINPDDKINNEKVIDILLRPTKIYVRNFFEIVKKFGYPKISANITGGGIPGNLSRMLPEKCSAVIDKKTLEFLSDKFCSRIFSYISRFVPESEMFKVFNMGSGFVLVYSEKKANEILKKMKDKIFKIGYISDKKSKERVIIN
ncbi:MAG: phosphoribosylformylglycinamidine cyclo-ligase [Candidatus Calescibacterium sp.]|nr:phosphoribosylformylglycinamidine cyclo-ligase [Candidatus Calescibacterium sp.]MDW8088039.1 phosphoribosylformylglycinamidine cyclo-ligase [Candidatus Calescibacterium sp.]